MTATIAGPDGRSRCRWCAATPEFMPYHDNEWAFPSMTTIAYSRSFASKAFNPVSAGARS